MAVAQTTIPSIPFDFHGETEKLIQIRDRLRAGTLSQVVDEASQVPSSAETTLDVAHVASDTSEDGEIAEDPPASNPKNAITAISNQPSATEAKVRAGTQSKHTTHQSTREPNAKRPRTENDVSRNDRKSDHTQVKANTLPIMSNAETNTPPKENQKQDSKAVKSRQFSGPVVASLTQPNSQFRSTG